MDKKNKNGFDILVIGAGACGLMTARELSNCGHHVTVLEARNRLGGRIHTVVDSAFSTPAELGAEFIHGRLPVTMDLIRESGIGLNVIGGEPWQARNGKLFRGYGFDLDTSAFEHQLKSLEVDMSLRDFLNNYFAGEKYSGLRKSITGFAEGYDAADTRRASTFAFRDEWLNSDDREQTRVSGGYGKLMKFLADEAASSGCVIHLSTAVTSIHWKKGFAEVTTHNQKTFRAAKLIVTVPLGVLLAPPSDPGAIQFVPAIPEKINAAGKLGYGAVIKILLRFSQAFWKNGTATEKQDLSRLGFLFSEQPVPTWWTNYPGPDPMICGWLAGPRAEAQRTAADEQLLDLSLNSLAAIFGSDKEALKKLCLASHIQNWTADPYARGAYAYTTVGAEQARSLLSETLEDTLYFAGEALYSGPEMGTVEAALASGKQTAEKIIHHHALH